MKQQNSNTKKTMLSSVIVMIVCIAMLIGATFAWFTDSVSNTGNRIQAGKLKVKLLMYDKDQSGDDKYKDISNGIGDIFKASAGIVYTDQIVHTARCFSAYLPPIQCTLSGHQCMIILFGHFYSGCC